MRIFCDTSVFVAASLEVHPHHAASKAVLERVRRGHDIGFTSGHSVAETFSVLTRIPTQPRLTSQDALAILERNVIPRFTLLVLGPLDYPDAIRTLTAKGFGGGRIYDFLHLHAARMVALDRIYTLNEAEWKKLAPELAGIIITPDTSHGA